MMRIVRVLAPVLTLVLVLSGSTAVNSLVWAQKPPAGRPNLMGDIEYDEKNTQGGGEIGDSDLSAEIEMEQEKKLANPVVVNQAGAIQQLKDLEAQMRRLAQGEAAKVRDYKDGELLHLGGAYLYCSILKGACPTVLDSILEVDIINSKIDNKAGCSNMERFWKIWKENKFQGKQDFHVRIAQVQKIRTFRQTVLPRYVGCQKTVAAEIADPTPGGTSAAFFAKRYAAGSLPRDSVLQTINLLTALKDKVQKEDLGDIFRAADML